MNENKLVVFWSKQKKDFLIRYPRSCDGHLVHWVFSGEHPRRDLRTGQTVFDKSFITELKERGYDVTTLRFSVERVQKSPASHQGAA